MSAITDIEAERQYEETLIKTVLGWVGDEQALAHAIIAALQDRFQITPNGFAAEDIHRHIEEIAEEELGEANACDPHRAEITASVVASPLWTREIAGLSVEQGNVELYETVKQFMEERGLL